MREVPHESAITITPSATARRPFKLPKAPGASLVLTIMNPDKPATAPARANAKSLPEPSIMIAIAATIGEYHITSFSILRRADLRSAFILFVRSVSLPCFIIPLSQPPDKHSVEPRPKDPIHPEATPYVHAYANRKTQSFPSCRFQRSTTNCPYISTNPKSSVRNYSRTCRFYSYKEHSQSTLFKRQAFTGLIIKKLTYATQHKISRGPWVYRTPPVEHISVKKCPLHLMF